MNDKLNKIKKELETGKWSEKLQYLLMEEKEIYFYKSLFDYIDKDFSTKEILHLGYVFGNNPDEKYFGFLNYGGDIYEFKTEKEMIERIKRLCDIEPYYNEVIGYVHETENVEYDIDVEVNYENDDIKIFMINGFIVNSRSEIEHYIKEWINDESPNSFNGSIKDIDELNDLRIEYTMNRVERIINACETINNSLSCDDVFTKEDYKKFQDSLDECRPMSKKEHIMINLANNYLDRHISFYGNCV